MGHPIVKIRLATDSKELDPPKNCTVQRFGAKRAYNTKFIMQLFFLKEDDPETWENCCNVFRRS